MTERWQHELKKLGGVDAPVSRMRARIANGPSEDPPQPLPGRSPRQRITAGVVAFAVFAAAGVFAYRALKPSDAVPGGQVSPTPSDEPAASDVVRLDLSTTNGATGCPGSPRGIISYGNQSTKGALTSYTWNCPGSSMTADTVAPSFSADDFVQAPIGVHLDATGDSTTAEGALQTFEGEYPWPTAHDLGDLAAGGDLQFEPGRYVLEVTARWSNGTLHFYFPIELVQGAGATPPPSTVPDVLRVSCDGGVPSIDDPAVAVRPDGLHVRLVGQPPPNEQLAFYGRDDFWAAMGVPETFASGGDTTAFTRAAATNTYDVKCFPLGTDPRTLNAAATVRVVDPNGYWVSTDLGCPFEDRGTIRIRDSVPDPTQEAAVRSLGGVLVSDTVERAGYTQHPSPSTATWRVLRNGEVVAWADVSGSPGEWQAGYGLGCVSAGTAGPPTSDGGVTQPSAGSNN